MPETPASTSPILSLPARVLLLGSGELGRELTISLKRLGSHVIAVDSHAHAPAMQVADEARVINMSDADELAALVDSVDVDVVVPEIEAIATHVLLDREQHRGLHVVPNATALVMTMDRQRIRSLATSLPDVRTSRFRFASNADEVAEALAHTGLPAFVKPTMSSSGHGQSRITRLEQAADAWQAAQSGARVGTGRVIVEEGVAFDSEITLLTVRSWDAASGQVVTSFCDPVGHRQVDGDYVESWQPAEVSRLALDRARAMARSVTSALAREGGGPCLGLFGVEFFIRGDQVWFSELSPRPHDTGMVTLVSQDQSEFDLHARAILGLPVDVTSTRPGASAVIKAPGVLRIPGYEGVGEALAHGGDVRIFSKSATRVGRRLGVALTVGNSVEQARSRAQDMASRVRVVERDIGATRASSM